MLHTIMWAYNWTFNSFLIPPGFSDNKLIVGGLRDKGDYSMSADPHVTQRIRSRAEELFPRLKVRLSGMSDL